TFTVAVHGRARVVPVAVDRRLIVRHSRDLRHTGSRALSASAVSAPRRNRPVNRESPLMFVDRVLSGMRPTGALHLGHYHGVLKNWVRLQHEFQCLFFVADWHALTTHYDTPEIIEQNVWDMLIDWLAAGVDPSQATIFIQSRVAQHAELHL